MKEVGNPFFNKCSEAFSKIVFVEALVKAITLGG